MNTQLKRTLRFTQRQVKEVKNHLLGRYPDRHGLFDVYNYVYRVVKPNQIVLQGPHISSRIMFSNNNEKLLIYSLTDRGFFSEVNNMINAAIYCASNDTGFVLDSNDFLYREKKGWEDYFVRFWSDIDLSKSNRLFYLKYRSDLQLWNRIRDYDYASVSVPEIGLFPDKVFENKQFIARKIWSFAPGIKNKINAFIKHLNLPRNFAACHIRRGDKVGELKGVPESERIEAKNYLERLLSLDPEIKTLFVCSDSYESVKEVEDYIHVKGLKIQVLTTCAPKNVGHSTELLKEQFDDRFEAVLRLLIDVEVSRKSSIFVGTYSSNLSRFIALMHDDINKCHSLDEEWHAG